MKKSRIVHGFCDNEYGTYAPISIRNKCARETIELPLLSHTREIMNYIDNL
jgi:hypothetical protein